MVYEDQIPAVLTAESQWVAWRTEARDGKKTKVPIDPATGGYATVNDAGTWHGFEDVLQYYRATNAVDGIGFVFREGGGYTGIDLDDCRDPAAETVDEWAAAVIHRLDSYTERSPSGTGFHVIVYGDVPNGGNRRGDVEMYDRDRYFTVTGDHVAGTPTTIEDRGEELRIVHEEYIAATEPSTVPAAGQPDVSLSDRELLDRAMNAANGDKFQQLWQGTWEGDYPSHSEADLALATLLAFWTGGDRSRIDALFRRSGLMRPKWDEDRGKQTYGELTIKTALENQTEFYEPEADA